MFNFKQTLVIIMKIISNFFIQEYCVYIIIIMNSHFLSLLIIINLEMIHLPKLTTQIDTSQN